LLPVFASPVAGPFEFAAKPPNWALKFFLDLGSVFLPIRVEDRHPGKREIMMRAALILMGLGILVAMELAAPPRTKTASAEPPLLQLTAKSSDSRDTLTKTDRLDMAHALDEASAQPISLMEPTRPAGSPAIIPEEVAKTADQRRRDTGVRTAAVMLPRPRPKIRDPQKAATPARSQAMTEPRSCRTNVIRDLLKTLRLSDGCET
jgi:hypothetical protein